jgi:hypothetical protein
MLPIIINEGGNSMINGNYVSPSIPRFFVVITFITTFMCVLATPVFADEKVSTGSSFEDFPYYKATKTLDLKGRAYSFQITDKRASFDKLECADIASSSDTELAGEVGVRYFQDYLVRMVKEASGKVTDTDSEEIRIDLEVFCHRIFGFVFARVYGLVQFRVTANGFEKRYCFHLKDGDPDSQLGMKSISTRTGAKRTLVASTATKAIETFLSDLEKRQETTAMGERRPLN